MLYYYYFGLCWVFVAAQAFSLVVGRPGYFEVAACGLLTVATSLIAEHGLSSCSSRTLEHSPSSCGAEAPGIKPTSPALAGRFFTI